MIDRMENVEKYLFIGAHPDDIEFGAGASLAKSVRLNIDCHAIIFSNCSESLAADEDRYTLVKESQKALAKLGVSADQISFLDFPVRKFPDSRQSILQSLVDVSRLNSFERVYLPSSFDVHQDHNVIHIEAIRAFKFSTILGYEMPWNHFSSALSFFEVLQEHDVNLKISSLSEFTSQKNRFYSSQDLISTTLKFRGMQINKDFAEAFEVIRWIEN
jgi:LmbE family N-acetylglucosaminyl deacetylase